MIWSTLIVLSLKLTAHQFIQTLFGNARSLVNQNISEVRQNWMGRKRLVKEELKGLLNGQMNVHLD